MSAAAIVCGVRLAAIGGVEWVAQAIAGHGPDGWTTQPGAIHPTFSGVAFRECMDGKFATLTHTASGLRLAFLWREDLEDAPSIETALRALCDGHDWTLTADEIARDPDLTTRMATATDRARAILGDESLTLPYRIAAPREAV